MNALIGHTGFVGSNISRQASFDECYNSKNIEQIRERSFDVIVCAGVSSLKWKANRHPNEDFLNIEQLIENMTKASFKKLILISTIAVYDNPADNAYGRNRLYLETFLSNKYDDVLIVRLPSLFGKGIKKNPIYDLLHKDYRFLPNPDSQFQYYCLDNLWKDITIAVENNIKYLNICSEPVVFSEVLNLFKTNIMILNEKTIYERMTSKHSAHWQRDDGYLYGKEETLKQMESFINEYE